MPNPLFATQALAGLKKAPVVPNEFDQSQFFHPRMPADTPAPDTSGTGGFPQGPDPFTKGVTDLQTMRDKQLSEMMRNREMNPQGSGAAPRDIADLQRDTAEDPYTGVQAHALQAHSEEALRGAREAGFENPQESARWGRNLENEKVHSPADVAMIQGQSSKDVANINKNALAGNYDKLAQILSGNNLGPNAEIDLPGGGKVRTGASLPGAAAKPAEEELIKLQKRRADLENPQGFDAAAAWLGGHGIPGFTPVEDQKKSLDAQILQKQNEMHGGGGPMVPRAGLPGAGGKPVQMRGPDGTIKFVSPELVEHFKSRGATVIGG